MMKILVQDPTKCLLARFGPNKLFGDNIDQRRQMDNASAIALFDRVWQEKLSRLVTKADGCDSRDAYERLTHKQREYFDFDQQHRSFRPQDLGAELVAQLRLLSDADAELTQLWRVLSSDTHPKTLFVTFDTVEEREQFRRLAQNLGINDEELGLRLLRDFMNKHPGRFLSGRV
jgi:hypothetical protein